MLIKIEKKTYQLAAQIIAVTIAVIIFLTFRNYGISWDEEIQSQYGQAIFDYYNSGFVDHRYKEIYNLYLYGGMFDMLAAFVNAYTPIDIYATRHLLNALIGLLGLWGTWRLGRLIGGEKTGLIALVLLALTPMYYGHMFNNPKDIPFACGVVWTLYYMCRILRIFPKISWQLIIKLGLVFGLTLGIRVGGVMLFGYWVLTLEALAMTILWSRFRLGHIIKNIEALKQAFKFDLQLAKIFISSALISYSVMLVFWPWAQEAPITNPWNALVQFSNFPNYVEVLLNGITYQSTNLPWYYLPVYFGVQLPLAHIILIIAGTVLLPCILRDLSHKVDRYSLFMVLLTAFVPAIYAIVRKPALYDAVRHFIFILPSLCILAALALLQLIKKTQYTIGKFQTQWKQRLAFAIIAFLFVAMLVQPAIAMIKLHPYEYIYINPAAGGVSKSYEKYELDYWGSSFKEAAEKLQQYVNEEGGIPPGKLYRIAICGPWSAAMVYLPPDYEAVEANEPAEFFLSTTRWKCQKMRPGKEIIRITRMGAPLSIVEDLRRLNDYKPE